jgi:hypothetical protein
MTSWNNKLIWALRVRMTWRLVRKEGGLESAYPSWSRVCWQFWNQSKWNIEHWSKYLPLSFICTKTLKIHWLWIVKCNCSAGAIISCTSKISSGLETAVDIQKCPLWTAITGCFDKHLLPSEVTYWQWGDGRAVNGNALNLTKQVFPFLMFNESTFS